MIKDGIGQMKEIVGKFIDSDEVDCRKHICQRALTRHTTVVKNGVRKTIAIKEEKQLAIERKVKAAFSKNDCALLFRDLEKVAN